MHQFAAVDQLNAAIAQRIVATGDADPEIERGPPATPLHIHVASTARPNLPRRHPGPAGPRGARGVTGRVREFRAISPARGTHARVRASCADVIAVNPRLALLRIVFVDPGRDPVFTAVDNDGRVYVVRIGKARALGRAMTAERTDVARTAAPLFQGGHVTTRAATSVLPTFATSSLAGLRLALRSRWPLDRALTAVYGTHKHRRERLTVRGAILNPAWAQGGAGRGYAELGTGETRADARMSPAGSGTVRRDAPAVRVRGGTG